MTNPEEDSDDCATCLYCQLEDVRGVIDMLAERLSYLEDQFHEQTKLLTGLIRVFSKMNPNTLKCTMKKIKESQTQ